MSTTICAALYHPRNADPIAGAPDASQVFQEVPRGKAAPSQLALVSNALLLARTAAGQAGTAGQWPASSRLVAGVATQSRPSGSYDTAACGVMAVMNVTFINYTAGGGASNSSQPFYAFEPCARCLQNQAGMTTLTSGLRFVQSGRPSLAFWSWGHQVGCGLDVMGCDGV